MTTQQQAAAEYQRLQAEHAAPTVDRGPLPTGYETDDPRTGMGAVVWLATAIALGLGAALLYFGIMWYLATRLPGYAIGAVVGAGMLALGMLATEKMLTRP